MQNPSIIQSKETSSGYADERNQEEDKGPPFGTCMGYRVDDKLLLLLYGKDQKINLQIPKTKLNLTRFQNRV